MGGRADRQQVHGGQLGVNIPAVLEEALVGQPAHGKRSAAIHHPLPVDAAVKRSGQCFNASVAGKVLTAVKHTAKQERCIDRGQLTAKEPLSAIDVNEVVEETVLVRTFFQEKGQGFLHSLLAIEGPEVVVFGGNAQGTQSKAGGCDAGNPAEGTSDNRRTVTHQAAPGAGLVKEEIAVPAGHVVEQGIGHPGNLGKRPVDEDAWRMSVFFRCLALGFWGGIGGARRCGRTVLQALADGQT